METIFDTPPPIVASELESLGVALDAAIPKKKASNLLIATWNIRKFGSLTRKWLPTGNYSPKRDLRALRAIIEILSRFDVIAVQEVTGNLRALRDSMAYLGVHWGFLMTDITLGDAGNHERLAFIFDNRRVQPSGLACEVVVPPKWLAGEDPRTTLDRQFARTPYAVSFKAGRETFILLTAHIDFGGECDRIPELEAIAAWMYDWATRTSKFHHNLLVLGDFNIDRRGDELWEAFMTTNLHVPPELESVKRSIFIQNGQDPRTDKYYDQIAWFNSGSGKARLNMEYSMGGGFDFLPHVYADGSLSKTSISHRISDHYPLWVEFKKET